MTNNELYNMDRNELNQKLVEAWGRVEEATKVLNGANARLDDHPDDTEVEAEFISAVEELDRTEHRHEFLLNENNRRIWGQ